ncbi:GNAT family N-acetyltransferase [Acinetobacter sp. S40]|uniref:GNAT family N-acetyltransferase n=1 Tax=Acinetobacter sp. S40 TaxID=2767434 RepID=UPI00190C6CF4|nr:GNAT family N-acetyltransferase [Acinetobacter sp. S40]MBJ9984361.1 GNAT family N-acetyltransferase [Acinetobacter sp. S40]
MNHLPIPIASSRLNILPFELKDCPDIYPYITLSLTQFMSWEPSQTFEEFENIGKKWLQAQAYATDRHFVLRDKTTHQFIGLIGIHRIHTQTPEFGLWIREDKHGSGFAKEALKSIYDWAVLNVKADYFVYPVAEQNFASRKLAEGLGGSISHVKQQPKYIQITYHIPAHAEHLN